MYIYSGITEVSREKNTEVVKLINSTNFQKRYMAAHINVIYFERISLKFVFQSLQRHKRKKKNFKSLLANKREQAAREANM